MKRRCETCPLNDVEVSNGTLLHSWLGLCEKEGKAADIVALPLDAYADNELRRRQLINSQAIAACYLHKVVEADCLATPADRLLRRNTPTLF